MAKFRKLGSVSKIFPPFQRKMTAPKDTKEKEKVEDVEMKDAEEEKVENLPMFISPFQIDLKFPYILVY